VRIAFVTESFSRGMGYTENTLPRYLAKRGHVVRVFCSDLQVYGSQPAYKEVYEPFLGPAHLPCGEEQESGFVVERLPSFLVGRYIGLRGLREALTKFHPDVVQATSVVSFGTIEVLLGSHALGNIPIFTECHQHLSVVRPYLRSSRCSLKRSLYFLTRTIPGHLLSRGVERCYAIAPDCEYVAIHHYGVPAQKVSVLHLGTDTETFHPVLGTQDLEDRAELRRELGIEPESLVAIYSGRLTDGKNPALLARAIGMVRASGHLWVGLFVGEGPQQNTIAHSDGCIVVGFARHDQLSRYYRVADVAVWPTQESMSMLDAMASGLPLLVSSSMGDVGRVEGAGLTFAPGSAEDLVAQLERLLDRKMRHKLGAAARDKALIEYDWNLNAERREADYVASLVSRIRRESGLPRDGGIS